MKSFDFDWYCTYKPGTRMAHADFFSRNPLPSEPHAINKIPKKIVHLTEITENWLLTEQQRDSETFAIVCKLRDGGLEVDVAKTYEMRCGILHRKIQRNGKTLRLSVIQRAFRWSVVNHVHEVTMHLGWAKTLDKLYGFYWFENMSKYVRKFVDNCITCKLSKPPTGKTQVELQPILKMNIPFHTIHIDITGTLSGKNDILGNM